MRRSKSLNTGRVATALVLTVGGVLLFPNGVAKAKPPTALRATKGKGTKAAKKPNKPVASKPAPAKSGAWRPCTVRARMARFSSYNMRKLAWYVYTQEYIHAEQKAECSGAGPLPKMRAFQPARIGGAVYVNGQLSIVDDRGQQLNASYSKYASESSFSSTNPNLTIQTLGMGYDDYSDGVYTDLSFEALLRGSSKFWGIRKEKSSTPDGGWEEKDVPFSVDDASLLFIGGGPKFDKGGKGVDGVDSSLIFRPSPGTARDPDRQAAADNARDLIALAEGGLAQSGDHYGATNGIQPNGYADVRLNRQYFVINTVDVLQTYETHFVAWIETDAKSQPKDLPPLDKDPNAPLERPIVSTPPPAA